MAAVAVAVARGTFHRPGYTPPTRPPSSRGLCPICHSRIVASPRRTRPGASPRLRVLATASPAALHVRRSVVLHRRVVIVCPAAQLDALDPVAPRPGPGLLVVELDEVARSAAAPAPGDERAAAPISCRHCPLDLRRNVSRCRPRFFSFRPVGRSWTGRLGELLALRILDEQRQGASEDLGEIPRGDLVAEQSLRLAKLLAQVPARRELDLEALLAQRLRSGARGTSRGGRRDRRGAKRRRGGSRVGCRGGTGTRECARRAPVPRGK
jgi:hypothetical protein